MIYLIRYRDTTSRDELIAHWLDAHIPNVCGMKPYRLAPNFLFHEWNSPLARTDWCHVCAFDPSALLPGMRAPLCSFIAW